MYTPEYRVPRSRSTRVRLLCLLLACLLGTCTFVQAQHQAPPSGEGPLQRGPHHQALGKQLDQHLSRLVAFGLSGAALVAKDGAVILKEGYGEANRAENVPVTARTPFVLSSLSKQFTAAAVLALWEDDRLALDDSLARFFLNAPEDKAGITVHQLLTHTAGLPYLDPAFPENVSREEVMQDALALPLDRALGNAFAYASPGYTLLAGIVEAASGQRYEDFVHERLFEPAGMTSTGFIADARWQDAPTRSYTNGEDEGPISAFANLPKTVGAGDVVSSAQM